LLVLKQICASGYGLLRYRDPAGRVVRIREHSLLADLEAGFKAKVVHHIDNDKSNNQLDNLWACASQSEHVAIHKTFEDLLPDLMRLGLVRFNKEKRAYELAEVQQATH
jgi:hypothetical protein